MGCKATLALEWRGYPEGISKRAALLAAAVGVFYVYVDLALNRMGVSAAAIGINAAMPALAWLLATPICSRTTNAVGCCSTQG